MHYVNSGRLAVRVAACLVAFALACSGGARTVGAPDFGGGSSRVEFVPETFQDLYPIFMRRRSMPLGEKAKLWNARYLGHYVRWIGTIRSFTPSGVTLKQLASTVTFDVSLWLESSQLALLHRKYQRGDQLAYIGRLDSYDDIFRTLYLGHGIIVEGPPPPSSASDAAP